MTTQVPYDGAPVLAPPCMHRGTEPVPVGPYEIFAGGTQYRLLMNEEMRRRYDLVISLTALSEKTERWFAESFGEQFWYMPLKDFGGVPPDWREFVARVAGELAAEKRILVFCIGSHGRTGTLIASLIALLESGTTDPIAAVRARHCPHAVETAAQADAVLALRRASSTEEVPAGIAVP